MKKLRGHSTSTLLSCQDIMEQKDFEDLIFQSKKIICNYVMKKKIAIVIDSDEFEDCIMEGLRFFNKGYDNRLGFKPSTYFYKIIICKFIYLNTKKQNRINNELDNKDNEASKVEPLYNTVSTIDTYNLTDLEKEIMKLKMKDRYKEIAIMLSRGLNLRQIGEYYGITKQAISKTVKQIAKNNEFKRFTKLELLV